MTISWFTRLSDRKTIDGRTLRPLSDRAGKMSQRVCFSAI